MAVKVFDRIGGDTIRLVLVNADKLTVDRRGPRDEGRR